MFGLFKKKRKTIASGVERSFVKREIKKEFVGDDKFVCIQQDTFCDSTNENLKTINTYTSKIFTDDLGSVEALNSSLCFSKSEKPTSFRSYRMIHDDLIGSDWTQLEFADGSKLSVVDFRLVDK